MTLESLDGALRDMDMMLPLLGSIIAGVLIGVEREFLGKPAGLRTHTLVCFSSALMTLLSLRMAEWAATFPEDTQIVSDMARMPHAILTGIGFLGAGVIFRSGFSIHGLTTAASLWLTASLGIVFGTGMVELAAISTAGALVVLVLLRALHQVAPPQPMIRVQVIVNDQSSYDGAHLAQRLVAHGFQPGPPSIRHDRITGLRHYTLLGAAYHMRQDLEALAREIQDDNAVREASVIPLEHETR